MRHDDDGGKAQVTVCDGDRRLVVAGWHGLWQEWTCMGFDDDNTDGFAGGLGYQWCILVLLLLSNG